MVRQCAWCLRLMNSVGERTSALPVPKIYEASHGICQVCGVLWLASVGKDTGKTASISLTEDGRYTVEKQEEVSIHSSSSL
jgi:hypothetical protein